MAERARGNILYEILIVILVIGLVATILYPSRVWNNEEELQEVCQARMNATHAMQLQYLYQVNTYTDTLSVLKEAILNDPYAIVAIDSVVDWDFVLPKSDLKELVLAKQFPDELRSIINQQLHDGTPLRYLATWDSLDYKLLDRLHTLLSDPSFEPTSTMDSSIAWPVVAGETAFWALLDNETVNNRIRRRTITSVQRGTPVHETRDWQEFRPFFYAKLKEVVEVAQRQDVYTKAQQDQWEEDRKATWETEMDTNTDANRDSIWNQNQQRFWDKDKELIWKKERNRLWKQEGEDWVESNRGMWKLAMVQRWKTERKKTWQDQALITLPDSMRIIFPAIKDSLWNVVQDSLQELEYDDWELTNKKSVDEMVRNIWEAERRVSWEPPARAAWLEEKESDRDALWIQIKEDLWNTEKPGLWRDEELKLEQKRGAMRRVDLTVRWLDVLGQDQVDNLVADLTLPNSDQLWKEINSRMKAKAASMSAAKQASVMYTSGLVGLFRNAFIDSLASCPLAHQPYLVTVVDTSATKEMSIYCPIVDTADVKYALKIDPTTGDSAMVELIIPGTQKLFGGGEIKTHGYIDAEGKRSWEKRGG